MPEPLQLVQIDVVKAVVEAALDGDVNFSLPAIADAAGTTVEEVQRVLGTDDYRRAVREFGDTLIQHALVRGIQKMDALVHGGGVKDRDRISAHNAIVQTLVALKQAKAPPAKTVAQELDDWLKKQTKAKRKRGASARRTRSRSEAAEAGQGGEHPPA